MLLFFATYIAKPKKMAIDNAFSITMYVVKIWHRLEILKRSFTKTGVNCNNKALKKTISAILSVGAESGA